jgi:predicted nucleic acid-binding protein
MAVERFRMAEQIFLPFVTMAELRAGFFAGTEGERNARVPSIFLNRARVRTLWPGENTTHHYARIWLPLRRQGTPIPTTDQQQEARSKGPRGSRPPG